MVMAKKKASASFVLRRLFWWDQEIKFGFISAYYQHEIVGMLYENKKEKTRPSVPCLFLAPVDTASKPQFKLKNNSYHEDTVVDRCHALWL